MNIFDPHISGSLSVSGSGEISGDLTVLGTLFATVSGTTQNAVSASHAAMYLLTSSFQTFTGSYTTGAFTGSFKGDGSGLYNIPASGVTGLNLTRIADGSATASISSVDGLRINSNTEITGTLKVNNFNLGGNDIVEITLTDAGGKYYINGVKNPRLSFIRGFKYRFYYDNINVHPLLFSLTNDGEHNGGTVYTTGVTTGSTPSFYVQIDVTDATASTLYYFCDFHVGMGNSISVYSDFLNAQSSVNLTNVDTGMFATTGSNNFTNIQRTSGSVVVTGSVDITGSITLNGQAIGTGKLDETVFNSYTSSNDGRVNSVEISTGSLNLFTSSIDTTIKNKLNTDGVISGSIQVQLTGTTGYSTFSSSIETTTSGLSSSIGSLSSSVATTTSGLSSSIGSISSSLSSTNDTQNNRLSGVETSTGSLNSFTSSIDTTIKNKLNTELVISGSVQVTLTETTGYSTFSSSISSSVANVSSSLSSTNDTQNNRLSSIETSTGSLNTFTGSIDTTIKNKLNTESVVSGSSQILISGTTGYSEFSSSITSSIGALSSSISTSIGSLSSSVATTTNDLSSSVALTTSGLTLSISSLSSSVATTTSGLSSSIGSLSSSIATTDLNQNNRLDSIEGKTGSYATTGSNIFQGSQTITGSLYISQDLIVGGSSSIQNISSSVLNIADNIITVNALNPAVRFGGLAVIDSGSSPQVSGSMLFDSVNNQWLFVHQNQGTITSSVLLMGPETYNNIGGETYLTLNRIPKGTGIEHLNDSNITDTGTKVSINSNTEVTGTLKVTGVISSPTITAIETSTSSLNTFTSSLLTAIELTGSNLTVKGDFLVKGTTTNVNTATLDVDNNLINLNGSGATFAGLRVKDTTAPSQVSGSLLWDSTNDYWVAGQLGSEQRIVRETEFNNAVTRIGIIETSTGSLNSFTSSINTTIKNKLNSDGVISGSSQVSFNGIADKPALVSGSSQITYGSISGIPSGIVSGSSQISFLSVSGIPSGLVSGSSQVLTGTGIWSGSAQLPSGVVSGSSQVLSGTGIWSGSAQLPSGVVSGSAQVISLLPSGTVSGSSQITGIGNSQLTNSSFNIGTTSISLGRASAAQTLTGVSIDGTVTKTIASAGAENFLYANVGSDDYVRIRAGSDSYNTGWIEIATSDDGTEPIYVRQYNGVFSTVARTATLLDGSGNTSFPGTINGLTVSSGTITSGTWNGTAIGDSYISSASNWNTAYNKRPSSLGFTTSTVTLTLGDSTTITASVPTFNQNTTGNAATVTNGVYTTGDQTIGGAKTFTGNMVIDSTDSYNSATPMLNIGGTGDGRLQVRHIWGKAADSASTDNIWLQYENASKHVQIGASGGGNNLYVSGDIYMNGYLTGSKVATESYVTSRGYLTGNQTISISGDASGSGTTSISLTVNQIDGVGFVNSNINNGLSANSIDSNVIGYVTNVDGSSTNLTGNSTDGAIYGQAYSSNWQHQIYGDYRTGIMYVRGKNNNTWQSWKRVALSSATTFTSVTSLTFTHNLGTANLTAQVFDTNGDMFFPSNIRISSTQVIVTFASSRSGRLVVTG